MSGIKYYQLAKDEELPDEFCVVRDVDGKPSEYVFYVPDAENAKLGMRVASLESALEGMHLIREQDKNENAKLRELCSDIWRSAYIDAHYGARLADRMCKLGIEVN